MPARTALIAAALAATGIGGPAAYALSPAVTTVVRHCTVTNVTRTTITARCSATPGIHIGHKTISVPRKYASKARVGTVLELKTDKNHPVNAKVIR